MSQPLWCGNSHVVCHDSLAARLKLGLLIEHRIEKALRPFNLENLHIVAHVRTKDWSWFNVELKLTRSSVH